MVSCSFLVIERLYVKSSLLAVLGLADLQLCAVEVTLGYSPSSADESVSSFTFFNPNSFLAILGRDGSKLLNSRLNLQLVVP